MLPSKLSALFNSVKTVRKLLKCLNIVVFGHFEKLKKLIVTQSIYCPPIWIVKTKEGTYDSK